MNYLIDILQNLKPGYYVEFSYPFENRPDLLLVRCRKGIWAKDKLVDKNLVMNHTNVNLEQMIAFAVVDGMEALDKIHPDPPVIDANS